MGIISPERVSARRRASRRAHRAQDAAATKQTAPAHHSAKEEAPALARALSLLTHISLGPCGRVLGWLWGRRGAKGGQSNPRTLALTRLHTHSYTHACTHAWPHMLAYARLLTCDTRLPTYLRTHTHLLTCAHMLAHTLAHTRLTTYLHTRLHTYLHAHACIHTCAHTLALARLLTYRGTHLHTRLCTCLPIHLHTREMWRKRERDGERGTERLQIRLPGNALLFCRNAVSELKLCVFNCQNHRFRWPGTRL